MGLLGDILPPRLMHWCSAPVHHGSSRFSFAVTQPQERVRCFTTARRRVCQVISFFRADENISTSAIPFGGRVNEISRW